MEIKERIQQVQDYVSEGLTLEEISEKMGLPILVIKFYNALIESRNKFPFKKKTEESN